MIYVWDNGMDYSDHGVYFIDVPAGKEAEAEELAAKLREVHPYKRESGFVLVAPVVEWRAGKPQPFDEWAARVREDIECYQDDVF